jgi:hypothetical protein
MSRLLVSIGTLDGKRGRADIQLLLVPGAASVMNVVEKRRWSEARAVPGGMEPRTLANLFRVIPRGKRGIQYSAALRFAGFPAFSGE